MGNARTERKKRGMKRKELRALGKSEDYIDSVIPRDGRIILPEYKDPNRKLTPEEIAEEAELDSELDYLSECGDR